MNSFRATNKLRSVICITDCYIPLFFALPRCQQLEVVALHCSAASGSGAALVHLCLVMKMCNLYIPV